MLIPAVFLLAAFIGLINGLAITRFNVHPIIATLSTQYIVLGITRILRPVSGGTVPEIVIAAVSGSFLGIPYPVFWGIVVILVGWKLLYGSRYGLHLFAIGGGIASGAESAARNFGVSDRRNSGSPICFSSAVTRRPRVAALRRVVPVAALKPPSRATSRNNLRSSQPISILQK
ncbi:MULTISPECIES: hypothetical protein [unclassified Mesorhizobium]|uniref:ABC transporter permease n=1 Tax=unclassified Mesorhizobium TaxID=325217 RepID=UPI00333BD6F2